MNWYLGLVYHSKNAMDFVAIICSAYYIVEILFVMFGNHKTTTGTVAYEDDLLRQSEYCAHARASSK